MQQQEREQGALLPTAQWKEALTLVHLEGAEDPKLDHEERSASRARALAAATMLPFRS